MNLLRRVNRFYKTKYIAFQNHNQDAAMSTGCDKLSYMDPRHRAANIPQVIPYTEDLPKEEEEQIEYKKYEYYKEKMLKGIVDKEQPQFEMRSTVPQHYYRNLSKVQLMTVSHPQSNDPNPLLHILYSHKFQPTLSTPLLYSFDLIALSAFEQIKSDQIILPPQQDDDDNQQIFKEVAADHNQFYVPKPYQEKPKSKWVNVYEEVKQRINNASFSELVQISLILRKYDCRERQFWYFIEEKYKEGEWLMQLNSYELIKLKYAFDHKFKFGSPKFHKILSSILAEDVPSLDYPHLVDLFHACRYSNKGQTNLQLIVLKQLQGHYKNMSYAERVDFYFTYASCTASLRLTKTERRDMFQYRKNAHNILFKMKLHDQTPNPDQCAKIIFSLAKMAATNTLHLTEGILQILKFNEQFYTDPLRVFLVIAYFPKTEGGIGVYNEEVFNKLKMAALTHWEHYSNIQRIRIVYTYWNFHKVDDTVKRMYLSVQVKVHSSLLFYFAQIQITLPTFRLREIYRNILCLHIIPLPFFQTFKRFYLAASVALGSVTEFDDKLLNTEYYYDARRQTDRLLDARFFKYYKTWADFSGLPVAHSAIPLFNLQMVNFAWVEYKIAVDLLTEKDYVPGSGRKVVKATYQAKGRTMELLNWKLLSIDEKQLRTVDAFTQLASIIVAKDPFIEEQQKIMQIEEDKQKMRLIKSQEYMDIVEGGEEEFQDFVNNYQSWDQSSSIINIGGITYDLANFHKGFKSGILNAPKDKDIFKERGKIHELKDILLPKIKEAKQNLNKLKDLPLANK